MKHRFIALLTVFVLCLSLVPTAFASYDPSYEENYDILVAQGLMENYVLGKEMTFTTATQGLGDPDTVIYLVASVYPYSFSLEWEWGNGYTSWKVKSEPPVQGIPIATGGIEEIFHHVMDLTEYDRTLSSPAPYSARGVFDYGTAVCDGYTRAIMLMSHEIGIPAIYIGVDGINHSYNLIFDSGEWKLLDSTWADTSEYYDPYYLVDRNSLESHIPNPDIDVTHDEAISFAEWYFDDLLGMYDFGTSDTSTEPTDPDSSTDTGLTYDPVTGYPIDPETGYPIDPITGLPTPPETSTSPYPIDPETGYPIHPSTGRPFDPATGFPIDPVSGLPYDPETGLVYDPTAIGPGEGRVYMTLSDADHLTQPEMAEILKGIDMFVGTGDGFELDRAPTRIELAVMFVRALGLEDEALAYTGENPFTDVPEWAVGYTAVLYNYGYAKGYGDGLYGSNDLGTERDYATFLLRAMGFSETGGDFTWESSVDVARQIGFAVDSETFLRGDVAEMTLRALLSLDSTFAKTLGIMLTKAA